MIKKIAVLSMAIIVMAIAKSDGAFVDTYWGVRALGMGGAFTAVANDANAPMYNIAGIANVAQQEVTLMGSRLFTGLEGVEIGANYLGYVYPIKDPKYGAVSFAWSSTAVPGLRREDTFNIGYARVINDLLRLDPEIINFSAGVNLKYLMQETKFDENDGDLSNTAGAMTGDVGLLAQFSNGLSVGFSSKYLVPADIGYESKDEVANVNVVGLAYYNDMLPALKIPYFTAALDVLFRDNETTVRVGLESYVIEGKLAVRLGGREEAFNIGFGYEMSFVNDTKLIIDYALDLPLQVTDSMGSHFISLSFRFP